MPNRFSWNFNDFETKRSKVVSKGRVPSTEAKLLARAECPANNAEIHTMKRSRVRVSETRAVSENGFRFTNDGQLDT